MADRLANWFIASGVLFTVALIVLVTRSGQIGAVVDSLIVLLGAIIFGRLSGRLTAHGIGLLTGKDTGRTSATHLLVQLVGLLALLSIPLLFYVGEVTMYFWVGASVTAITTLTGRLLHL